MQPRFTFPGINDYLSVRYTLGHGITPGRIQVVALAETVRPARQGDATFSDPTTGAIFTMPDCIVDKPTFQRQSDGRTLARIDILDQRWRWQRFGQISGQWNLRTPDGTSLVPGTQSAPRDLLRKCCDAIGIDRPDLSKVPNFARPFVDWDIANPAQALAQVADAVGCVVVLKPGGRVAIEPIGQGKPLPQNEWILAGQTGYDLPELPLAIEFFAGPSLYQIDAQLEAVGEDIDGQIRPLNQLSYQPASGWPTTSPPDFLSVDPRYRTLAQRSVYRMYRVVPPKHLPGVVKSRQNEIHSLDELLPLLSTQIERQAMPDGRQQRRPVWIYGNFDRGNLPAECDAPHGIVHRNLGDQPQQLYSRGFQLDRQRGIVHFAEPVFVWKNEEAARVISPADLHIRVAVRWRKSKQRDLQHWSVVRGRKSRKMPPLCIHRSDIALESYFDFARNRVVDNQDELLRQANYYLDQTEANLRPHELGGASYVGLHPIEPDGAIRQVSWSIETQGTLASRTDASVNFDDPTLDVSFQEKRFVEKMQHSLRQQTQHAQAQGIAR